MAPGRENRAPGLRHEVQVWGSLPEEGVTVFQAGGSAYKGEEVG